MAKFDAVPTPIKVRLKWADGSLETLDGTFDGTKDEIFHDKGGKTHRFEDSGEVEADDYHVFTESD